MNATSRSGYHQPETCMQPDNSSGGAVAPGNWIAVILAWLAVGLPLAWGVFMTFKKAALLFQ